ncbi:MAG: hypothetical protein DRI88_12685 [Bacteroidetes bacterium]|nr:MAG: hypothetical protein DRI88_12685 [Bacteroidota bacterium]
MKRFLNVFLLAVILPAFVITGCKDDDNPQPQPKGTYATLSQYMTDNGLDLPDLLTTPSSWVVAPTLIDGKGGIVDPNDYSIPNYHVLDIRNTEDFDDGHIKGAIHTSLGDIITKAKEVGTDKPILVVCYTGQTAARAVMALRLSGFPDAQVMKFGMSYWNEVFDKWTPNISDQAVGDPNWVTDASGSLPSNDYPDWESNTTDGEDLLAERVNSMLSKDWTIKSDVVLGDPAGYDIYNFWTNEDYTTFGHYKGAYQYKPISIANDILKALPQSDECLIYCYTGQTSSFIAAWLQVLGYNAKSILFGVNSLSHTALSDAGKPAWHHSNDYDYETSK